MTVATEATAEPSSSLYCLALVSVDETFLSPSENNPGVSLVTIGNTKVINLLVLNTRSS